MLRQNIHKTKITVGHEVRNFEILFELITENYILNHVLAKNLISNYALENTFLKKIPKTCLTRPVE